MTDVPGPPSSAFASRRPLRLRLSPAARKTTLIVHLIASMGWLTLMVCVLVLALGTPWRLFRYHWVAVKFWLTLAATVASNLALTARLHDAAHAAIRHPTGAIERMDLGFLPYNLVIISCVAIALYTTTVVLSVAKPWGPRAKYRRAR
ncbi:hypothetical protein [Actinoallomurus sp. NPDC052274]|uniref:hypothetical protein n=1 Tax=Actinoallomurus sp. NPDC052274 TaxID=3155420 RepID=UPI00343971DA